MVGRTRAQAVAALAALDKELEPPNPETAAALAAWAAAEQDRRRLTAGLTAENREETALKVERVLEVFGEQELRSVLAREIVDRELAERDRDRLIAQLLALLRVHDKRQQKINDSQRNRRLGKPAAPDMARPETSSPDRNDLIRKRWLALKAQGHHDATKQVARQFGLSERAVRKIKQKGG